MTFDGAVDSSATMVFDAGVTSQRQSRRSSPQTIDFMAYGRGLICLSLEKSDRVEAVGLSMLVDTHARSPVRHSPFRSK